MINKTIRWIDADEEESKYIKHKFDKKDLIDITTRENINELVKTPLIMKCCYRTNHYSNKDIKINDREIKNECPRCLQQEI